MTLARAFALTLALFAGPAAHAASFTFATLPATGVLSGAPGDTLGFGYFVENPSATDWLVITSLDAGTFLDGTPDASLFDFPVLAPGASLTTAFVAGTSGLFAFTWDAAAPLGSTNAGSFVLGAEWWSGDPLSGGVFLSLATPASAAYQVSVVPEPAAALLVAASLALAVGWAVRVRRSSRNAHAPNCPSMPRSSNARRLRWAGGAIEANRRTQGASR